MKYEFKNGGIIKGKSYDSMELEEIKTLVLSGDFYMTREQERRLLMSMGKHGYVLRFKRIMRRIWHEIKNF